MSDFGPQVASCIQITPEAIDEMLYQFRQPMIDIKIREMVLEKWSEIGSAVWYNLDQWQQSDSDGGIVGDVSLPTQRWSSITNCAVPYDADDGELQTIQNEGDEIASHEYSRNAARLASILYPDSLQDIANTVDRLNRLKETVDDFIAGQEESGFPKIEELFADWSGGEDDEAAFLAFGHIRDTAGTQRAFLRELIQVTISEFALQAATRNGLGERLSRLVERLIEAQTERGYALQIAYTATTTFTPLGYIDSALSVVESMMMDSGEGTKWFNDFKDRYLTGDYDIGVNPDTFATLVEALGSVMESAEITLSEGRSVVTELANEINSDYSGLIQGEVY
jgi:GNAT superfamily N-acetyltransferase